MSDQCFRIEELAEVARLPVDDPRRAHLARCPRCRARLASYKAFMDSAELPEGADTADAKSRLSLAMQREIFGVHAAQIEADASVSRSTGRDSGASPEGPIRRLMQLLTMPALRPVWAVGVVALLVVVVHEALQPARVTQGPITLRGTDEGSGAAVAAEARVLEDGSILFSWNPITDADRYELVLYGADLSEIGRLDAGPANFLMLRPDARPEAARHGVGLFWRVLCLRGGDELVRSALGGVRIPE
jgi:hypothetical protein